MDDLKDSPLPAPRLDRFPEPPLADHNHALRVSRFGVQVAQSDPLVAARGDHIDGSRGRILIEHDVIGHGAHSSWDRA